MKTAAKLIAGGAVALLAVGVFAGLPLVKKQLTAGAYVAVDHVGDFSDDRQLVGAVQNVFVGKVVEQAGTKALGKLPETQFHVEVVENIKGELSGTVLVNQQGGYKDDQLILMEHDKLLKPGKTYVFATRHLESENWHTVVPFYGDLETKDDKEKKALVEKFKKAHKAEIKPKFAN